MSKYIFPTTMHTVSDNFAAHVARGSVNPGTDYQTVDNTGWHKPVYAVADGVIKVVSNGINGSGGRYVQYVDKYGVTFQDLHLSQILVSVGQSVTQGQQIAISGASANGSETGTGGPHLHHSMIVRGTNVDFELYVDNVNSNATLIDKDDDVLTPEQAQQLADANLNAAEARKAIGVLGARIDDALAAIFAQATDANANSAEARRLGGIQTGGLAPTSNEAPH